MGLITRIREKIYYSHPHWQVFEGEDGRMVVCSNCGCESELKNVYLPKETDTLMDIAMGDIDMAEGYYLPRYCPGCGAVLAKEDTYFIPEEDEG